MWVLWSCRLPLACLPFPGLQAFPASQVPFQTCPWSSLACPSCSFSFLQMELHRRRASGEGSPRVPVSLPLFLVHGDSELVGGVATFRWMSGHLDRKVTQRGIVRSLEHAFGLRVSVPDDGTGGIEGHSLGHVGELQGHILVEVL